jgi:hypothetical protein
MWIGSSLCWLAAPEPEIEVEIVQVVEVVASMEVAPIEATTPTSTATPTPTSTSTATPTEAPTTTAPPTNDDPVTTFVRAVTEVALAYGAADTAAHIEALFNLGAPAPDLSPAAEAALIAGNILESSDEGTRATPWFASTSTAWQSVLRGESGDLSACGESTLDNWTADLIARLVANPDKAPTIRRDLRRRGIAAFGML